MFFNAGHKESLMKKKIKSKAIHKTLPLTKSLGGLMKDEDGFVSKETILKVGLSTVAAFGITGALTDITSGCGYTHTNTATHSNAFSTNAQEASVKPNCVSHHNVTNHTSY